MIADAANPAITTATQWFERTLDDSANKRIPVPEAFLSIDAILNIYLNVAYGLIVHEKVIAKHIQEELPFMASENIMMDAVRRGGDRQVLHEEIRKMSIEAGRVVKERGRPEQSVGADRSEPHVWYVSQGDLCPYGSVPVYWPLPAAGGRVPGGNDQPEAGQICRCPQG